MERYTMHERIIIIKAYYRFGENATNTIRGLRNAFGLHNRPSRAAIKKLIDKFERTGSVLDLPRPVRPRSGRSLENIAAVIQIIRDNPLTSIRRLSQQLGLSYSSTQRILTKDLHMNVKRKASEENEGKLNGTKFHIEIPVSFERKAEIKSGGSS